MALKIDDSIVDAHKKSGIYNSNMQHWKEAENEFSEVLKLDPTLISLKKLRGVARYYLKDYEGSIDDFTEYLKIDSTDDETYISRATAYEALGRDIEATKDMSKAAESKIRLTGYNTLNYPDFISLINVLLEAGDTTKALHHLNIFTSKNQSVAAHVITVKILLSRGDWEETYKEVVKGLET
ncbi:MAG: hypothetical protein RIF34_00435, partial [Candidatus Kapaibacterium sp.]